MFDELSDQDRLNLARDKLERVINHFVYLIALHENNDIVLYSDKLSSQIPKSYAANAFNIFREAMHQIEIVRLCALWDSADVDKENIPTVIALINKPRIIDALAEEVRACWLGKTVQNVNPSDDPATLAVQEEMMERQKVRAAEAQALKAKEAVQRAIAETDTVLGSKLLASVMNLRDKHLAHVLTQTRREKRGAVELAKYKEVAAVSTYLSVVHHPLCTHGTCLFG